MALLGRNKNKQKQEQELPQHKHGGLDTENVDKIEEPKITEQPKQSQVVTKQPNQKPKMESLVDFLY